MNTQMLEHAYDLYLVIQDDQSKLARASYLARDNQELHEAYQRRLYAIENTLRRIEDLLDKNGYKYKTR